MAASSFPRNPTALRPLSFIRLKALMTFITIMKRRDICKPDYAGSLQSEISSRYRREAVRFQHLHNSTRPGNRIWRHMLYERVFHFLRGGILLDVRVEIVRFIYVDSGRTFTFYGSLFLPRIRYAGEFVSMSISSSGSESRSFLSMETLRRWKKALASFPLAQDHNSAPPLSPPGMV